MCSPDRKSVLSEGTKGDNRTVKARLPLSSELKVCYTIMEPEFYLQVNSASLKGTVIKHYCPVNAAVLRVLLQVGLFPGSDKKKKGTEETC